MSEGRRRRVQREADILAEDTGLQSLLTGDGPQGQLATNTGVRLACTMAAMFSPFAAFLCWAERDSRVIRRFAVQSAALLVVHVLCAALLAAVGFLCGGVPYFGFLVSLICWLFYIAAVLVLLAFRFRLMECAWHGRRFNVPLLEKLLSRYY